ncbi:hypothetical protein SHL15_7861 [Streptomyces hygroscopicus subsp. limoneus]|nr:hypothetical protein SHL15_7861 [Streptomyces hygroscopicus subsp. limoneus]
MDFPAALEIVDARRARADSVLFGYTPFNEEHAHGLKAWWTCRHGFAVAPDDPTPAASRNQTRRARDEAERAAGT